MDYPLENLGPERFQQVCQALLVRELPDIQCFPVGQPDGGRDAVASYMLQRKVKFGVYQVKYARRPLSESDPHKWLIAIAEDEAPKIAALIPKGASRYVLITNISGTAHPDVGSIDKMNAVLSKAIGIPSMCWWRDDLNRRLEDAWSIKWAYPEIMAGPDFLRALVESGLTEHKERRAAAIRAFLRHQYENDEEVRFKQVELQNKLLDLFIDVPMALRESGSERKRPRTVLDIALTPERGDDATPDEPTSQVWYDPASHESPVGAATLLLNPAIQSAMPHLVLEGAPGQGKSTIAQYVCQVHRMKLLAESDPLDTLPKEHKNAPIRLPIKIDLRDFATWLGKKNPFVADDNAESPAGWHKSMEAFIAALITHQSGGALFTTDDLLAVSKISAVLIVLDGLDEVADIAKRREVVEEIGKGTLRLQENSASLQTVVTSRPAAFANSPGMPEGRYPHFQLLDLRSQLILQYAERWLRARRLDGRLSAEFRKILKTKLDQPHLRDLARNPMQLTILLSLILTRGASLPDKRTALYDYYIDLFFNRESEKSAVVRDLRDLLIDIHRYLAWLLHSEAEKGDTRASISHERLQRVVAEYLTAEGHDPAIAQELFTGMVERVVALVSRVQGTFEFEVQPLREYFAACYLFFTAPQSSPGKEKPGARPDRFDAIARNFYWLNVARFYAGCYSKGELPSLVERLQDLCAQPGYDSISHPRQLAATLLADWVFMQNRRSVQQVVDLIMDPVGLRFLVNQSSYVRHIRAPNGGLPELAPKCGREELVSRCFEILRGDIPGDFAEGIISLLKVNTSSPSELAPFWIEQTNAHSGEKRLRWLKYGVELGVLSTVDITKVRGMDERPHDKQTLAALFRARRLDFLERSEATFDSVADAILERAIIAQPQRRVESALDILVHAVNPSRYAITFQERHPVPLATRLEQRNWPAKLSWNSQFATATELYANHSRCVDLGRVADEEVQQLGDVWACDLAPWDRIVETARALFGQRWAFYYLANIAAGIRSTTERGADYDHLLDEERSLCRRTRYARLRSTSLKWWREQLDKKGTADQLLFALLVSLTWAAPKTIVGLLESIEPALLKLTDQQWHLLFHSLRRAVIWTSSGRLANSWRITAKDLPKNLTLRAACIFAARAAPASSLGIYKRFLSGRLTEDDIVLEFAQQEALDAENLFSKDWKPNLELIRRCYALGQTDEPYMFYRFARPVRPEGMPLRTATEIARDAASYPGYLVGLAEQRCRDAVSTTIVPVADLAARDGWLDAHV